MPRRKSPRTSAGLVLVDASLPGELCNVSQTAGTACTTWDEEDSVAESYDEYDVQDFTREEIERYNRMASPASRLKRKADVLDGEDHESSMYTHLPEDARSGRQTPELSGKGKPKKTKTRPDIEALPKKGVLGTGFSGSNDAVSVTAAAEGTSMKEPVPLPRIHNQSTGQATPPPTPRRTPRQRRARGPVSSPYFPVTTLSSPKRTNTTYIPYPPLSFSTFGLVQERLANDPFRLLIAVIFLNKTRGTVAIPVFYELMQRYSSIQALANAKHEDVVGILQHLGLQNARAKKIVGLAKTWLEKPPLKGKRYRCLHYPRRGDGSDVKADECLPDESEDPRVGWEVAHLPGIGVYGLDSWRIFCRDALRGIEGGKEEDGEWTRVLPLDKELRAYLRWRWLKLGWVWDPITGKRERVEDEKLREAEKGGVMIEGDEVAAR